MLRNMWHALTREMPERRYERRILERMARGDLTNTLGIQIRDEAQIRAEAERWLAVLIELGLRPDALCVEYGCGSLWCAEPVIRHLQPGRFIGLGVISRRTLGEVAAMRPASRP